MGILAQGYEVEGVDAKGHLPPYGEQARNFAGLLRVEKADEQGYEKDRPRESCQNPIGAIEIECRESDDLVPMVCQGTFYIDFARQEHQRRQENQAGSDGYGQGVAIEDVRVPAYESSCQKEGQHVDVVQHRGLGDELGCQCSEYNI